MSKRPLLYLVTRENILAPGVMKSQVLELAGHIRKEGRGSEILILNFPSLHSFLRHLRNYRRVKSYASKLGVNLAVIPIFPIGRSTMPIWAIPFLLIQTIPFVLFFIIKHRVKIILARGYLSALLADSVKKLLKVKTIFEVHGPYLLEGVAHGRWDAVNSNYRAWERIERSLFKNSDDIIARSLGIFEYVKHISPKSNVSVIPCSVDVGRFSISAAGRDRMRKRLGFGDRFVVVYSGSLGSFHRPEFLAEFYASIRRYLPKPFFLIATHSEHDPLTRDLADRDVPEEEFMVVNNPPDLGAFLPLGDAALHIYDGESQIAPFALSAKIAEYTASGLPVVVTDNIYSAVEVVDKNGAGVVVNPLDRKDIQVKMQKLVRERETFKKNALRLAKEYFSVKVCARKYLEIYDELASKNKS